MTDCSCTAYPPSTPDIGRLGLGVAALRYQTQGYAVLPLVRGGKKPHRMLPWDPATPSGVHWASTDPRAPEWAWSQDPAANVGVATGLVSRLVVIDLDVKGSQDGPGNFAQFVGQNKLQMPAPACWVATPSGGMHIWLRIPPEWGGNAVVTRHGILPGVDVQGDGSLVVAPPSMKLVNPINRPGERQADPVAVPYSWTSGCPHTVPAAPAWLAQWLAQATANYSIPKPASEDSPDLDLLRETGVAAGERNTTLYRLACARYRHHGLSAAGLQAVWIELCEVLAASDRGDFGMSELARIAMSARQFIEARQQAEIRAYGDALRALERK